MGKIERYDVNEEWAHSGIIKAGDFCYLGYCVGNIGGTIEEQINGAFDHMEKIIKERFNGKYPVRKSIQTEFAHVGGKEGLQFQVDAVAYCGK